MFEQCGQTGEERISLGVGDGEKTEGGRRTEQHLRMALLGLTEQRARLDEAARLLK